MTILSVAAISDQGRTPKDDNRPSSLVQRPAKRSSIDTAQRGNNANPAVFPKEFRTIDGSFNNAANPHWGAAGFTLLRQTPVTYDDGVGNVPGGTDRPNPRDVSNALCEQLESRPNARRAAAFLWQWGQFLDHDIDETPITDPAEQWDIPIPTGDPWFDPKNTGKVVMGFDRSAYDMVENVRQQLNNISSYIDASNVYGSDAKRAAALRANDGTGRLKTSPGDLLPFNVDGFDNAPTGKDPSFFLAGDVRCNEQVALTAMHTLWVREHNTWADVFNIMLPMLTGDEVYEYTRAIIVAEMQVITYREFLPVLLGDNPLPPYSGYDPSVDASISNIFATAAYRVGHTMLTSPLMRTDATGQPIPAGHLSLADAFFSPQEITSHGIDPLLRGLCGMPAQEIDPFVRDDVRNFLFGPPGAGGFDLPALNIQRGRDHGLATYNQVRESFGRLPAVSWADVTPDASIQARLASVYDSPAEIDAWVGLLSEPHRPGAMVGETLALVLTDQFQRLRDGDRFWYQSYLPPETVELVEAQTLAIVIRRNTGIGEELPDDVFTMPDVCLGDLDGSTTVDLNDLLALIDAWGPCAACPEDVNDDQVVDLFDLLAVLDAWGPCP